LQEFLDFVFSEPPVPGAFRVDHYIRSLAALPQAAAKRDADFSFQPCPLEAFLKGLEGFFSAFLCTGEARADEEVVIS